LSLQLFLIKTSSQMKTPISNLTLEQRLQICNLLDPTCPVDKWDAYDEESEQEHKELYHPNCYS
jgi:hypothetical protein